MLKDSNIQTDESGAIKCDPFLMTNDMNILAAGDVCSYFSLTTGQRERASHWQIASE
jgi:pyruvate/2-oxoglutarate dehydrogenase complex dihydrolipoamide dehydrogenase (E3) component